MTTPTRKSGVVIPHTLRWHGALAAAAAHSITRLFDSTWRLELENASDTLATIGNRQVIFSLWHNRLLLAPPSYRKFFLARQPHRRLAALVSASKDGAILARVMEYHGIRPVLGSSSRRGAQALRELNSWAKRGYDFAITPDGPRGPRYEVQPGAVMLLARARPYSKGPSSSNCVRRARYFSPSGAPLVCLRPNIVHDRIKPRTRSA